MRTIYDYGGEVENYIEFDSKEFYSGSSNKRWIGLFSRGVTEGPEKADVIPISQMI